MRQEMLERRKEIVTLLAHGFSLMDIAEALGIPVDTVYNDMRTIKQSACEELLGHTRREVYHLIALRANARVKELWRCVAGSKNNWVKVQLLKNLRLEDQFLIEFLSKLGLPFESPEEANKRFGDASDYPLGVTPPA